MKVKQRVTLLGGVGLTLLGLLYSLRGLYPTYNAEPLLLGPYEKECPPMTSPCNITIDIHNGMGNKILFYWFLMAAAKRHHCTAYLSPNMAGELLPHFRLTTPALTPEVYYTTAWTSVDFEEAFSKCRPEIIGESINILGFPSDFRPLFPLVEDLRRELTLKPEVVDRAQRKLKKLGRTKGYKTIVGVHARRGDYVPLNVDRRILSTDSQFYSSAMAHFRSKYGQVAFVVVSDDMKWCKENIVSENGDVFYGGSGVAIDDFALMANCNHSVIGYSTFAYFAAILSAGDVVYHANYSYTENWLYNTINLGRMALEHWTPIAADLSQLPPLTPLEEIKFNLNINYVQKRKHHLNYYIYPTYNFATKALFYLPRVFPSAEEFGEEMKQVINKKNLPVNYYNM